MSAAARVAASRRGIIFFSMETRSSVLKTPGGGGRVVFIGRGRGGGKRRPNGFPNHGKSLHWVGAFFGLWQKPFFKNQMGRQIYLFFSDGSWALFPARRRVGALAPFSCLALPSPPALWLLFLAGRPLGALAPFPCSAPFPGPSWRFWRLFVSFPFPPPKFGPIPRREHVAALPLRRRESVTSVDAGATTPTGSGSGRPTRFFCVIIISRK